MYQPSSKIQKLLWSGNFVESENSALCGDVVKMVSLPDVVELFDGRGSSSFNIEREISVTAFIVIACVVTYVYAHIFLDDNLRWKNIKSKQT